MKSIFITFKGFSIVRNCVRRESGPVNSNQSFQLQEEDLGTLLLVNCSSLGQKLTL